MRLDGRAALRRIRSAFLNRDGGLRGGWMLLASVLALTLVSMIVRLGLQAVFAALFQAWGIHAENFLRAPRWAQLIYAWHGSAITVVMSLAVIALSGLLCRCWRISPLPAAGGARRCLKPMLAGAGIALGSAAVFLATDSMRLEWPLSRPHLSMALPVLLGITMLSGLAEEAFNKRVVFDGLRRRWGAGWAAVVSCALFFAANGGYAGNVLCGINVLIMGAVCCALYLRGGIWASAGFRCGWSFASVMVAGFGNAATQQSIYALYGVSEAWLTGGDGGPIYGAWMTLVLLALLVALNWCALKAMWLRLSDRLRAAHKKSVHGK